MHIKRHFYSGNSISLLRITRMSVFGSYLYMVIDIWWQLTFESAHIMYTFDVVYKLFNAVIISFCLAIKYGFIDTLTKNNKCL